MQTYLCVDIGGSKLEIGIVDETGAVRRAERLDFTGRYKKEDLLAGIRSLTAALPLEDVTAGGVNVPGLCNPLDGHWLSAPFTGIGEWPITEVLASLFGVPFYAENDVNACALAERRFGICGKTDNFMWISLSNGVGGAVFLQGSLLRGSRFGAGEIGHFVVEENGDRCDCGNRGCLETTASGRGIAAYYERLTGVQTSAEAIAVFADKSDTAAQNAFRRAGRGLGRAAAGAANLLNIDTFVIGGGVAGSFELFADTALAVASERVLKTAVPALHFVPTGLGRQAALLGAAAVAMAGEEKQ